MTNYITLIISQYLSLRCLAADHTTAS